MRVAKRTPDQRAAYMKADERSRLYLVDDLEMAAKARDRTRRPSNIASLQTWHTKGRIRNRYGVNVSAEEIQSWAAQMGTRSIKPGLVYIGTPINPTYHCYDLWLVIRDDLELVVSYDVVSGAIATALPLDCIELRFNGNRFEKLVGGGSRAMREYWKAKRA